MKHVYTLADLEQNKLPANAKLAVIGDPIQHSASPQMHQAALSALKLDLSYIRIQVKFGEVTRALQLMKHLHFLGCNITIPHKLEALAQCDQLSSSAKRLGAVNTICFRQDTIYGDNTDGAGLAEALQQDLAFKISNSRILILGAGGGAGKAIATQLAFDGCATLYLSNRTTSKIEPLATSLAQQTSATCFCIDHSALALERVSDQIDLIINASSLGMKEDDPDPFPPHCLNAHHKVYDIIYKPSKTKLLHAASKARAMNANGISMLVNQGALSLEQWIHKKPDKDLMQAAIS